MNAVTLIYPHQLYAANPALAQGRPVLLLEDVLFFRQYAFHKKKIAFHRATMAGMLEKLQQQGYSTRLVTSRSEEAETSALLRSLHQQGVQVLHVVEPDDYLLDRRLAREAMRWGMRLVYYSNPGFIISRSEGAEWLNNNRIHQTSWYMHFRKSLDILMDPQGKPQGGAWTFDTDNRQKTPAGFIPPQLPGIPIDAHISEAIRSTLEEFPDNPGSLDTWEYPVSHDAAEAWLNVFLDQRFNHFGRYQDAMLPGASFLFHSVISPMMNVGLLTPDRVLDRAIEVAEAGKVHIASLEGFVRQILGWREFVRAVYHHRGTAMRTANALQLEAPMPKAFYTGTTGIYPFDESLKRLLNTGYSHHIERLMIHGNLMLLLGIHPNAVYQWFMELFIDAYDWVMVPNVYGMSQYADFGGMVTKPYVSGSAYLHKMGHFAKAAWCAEWDSLYWMFIQKHRESLRKNPRMAIPVASLGRMNEEKLRAMSLTFVGLKTRLGMI